MKGTVNYREINKNVMDNTMELCGKMDSLKKSIDNSIKNEYLVYQSEVFNAGEIKKILK